MQERTKSCISPSCTSGWEGIKWSKYFSCPRKMKNCSSATAFWAAHKRQSCTRDSCQGRQRDAFAVHKCYGLRRTLLPAGFCWCKARNPVDDWACQKKHCVSFVLEEIQAAMWLLWLTSSLLIPSLLVVGSMLQSPCNLESFGAYTN